MALAVLIAGILAVIAGLVAGYFGFSPRELSDNAGILVLVGTIGVCSGLLLMGLYAVLVELKKIVHGLDSAALSENRGRPAFAPDVVAPVGESALELGSAEDGEPSLPPGPPAWLGEAAREWQHTETPLTDTSAPSDQAPRRRKPLFTRGERERTQAKMPEAFPPEPHPAPSAPEPSDPSPPRFEDAWPKPERSRPREAAVSRRPPVMPPNASEPADPTPPPEQSAVTVLKSGVVDGMAYSLYSDGSIEAQMPEGMVRFTSIDDLRAHLDQRS